MKDRAYCKINLALDVTGRRSDGYHDLRSIMVPCDFYDEVDIEKSEKTEYICEKKHIFFDRNNTVVKAVDMMKQEFGITDNFRVFLNKHIPMQAGLGGGSTDGASVIRIFNRMYDLKLSDEKIRELCLKIGSDVLFNYHNRPALVEGTGDRLSFITVKDDYYVLLIKPRKGVSTRECYETLDLEDCAHPDVDLIKEKLEKGEEVKHLLSNSLERPALELCRDIRRAMDDMKEAGADFVMVSGSGSSIFTIDKDRKVIRDLKAKMMNKGYFVRSTRILK